MTAALAEVVLADEPATWAGLGFAVDRHGGVALGGVVLRLAGHRAGDGLVGIALRDGRVPPGADIDGIRVLDSAEAAAPRDLHPNGAIALDHVVVTTPSLHRTAGALEDAGLDLRRTRDVPAQGGGAPLRQAFLLAGPCVIEVVGPQAQDAPAGQAALWGVTVVVDDLDALARRLGPLLGPPRDAVQPGRRIATLRSEAGVACPVAFMTPRVRGASRDRMTSY